MVNFPLIVPVAQIVVCSVDVDDDEEELDDDDVVAAQVAQVKNDKTPSK